MKQRTTRDNQTFMALAGAALLCCSLGAAAQPGGNSAAAGGASAPKAGTAATQGSPVSVDRADRAFVEAAARDGMAEVMVGRMAQDKASNAQVKAFGERMAQDHGKANAELLMIAGTRGIAAPNDAGAEHKKHADRLTKLSGADFDRAYMKLMVEDHAKDVKSFERASKSAKDADIRAFAARTLPTLQSHLQMARTTQAAVKAAK
ncbi:MAG: DUF4142 domain-containing protein [Rubrivivax sp.]|nr:DUF4142 domain-containing protein [Rubrivivax sp.]